MPGIPRNLAEHSLKVHKDARPVKQAMRRFSGPKRDEISREIDRLLNAKFIREIKDSDWVANSVLVEKKKTKKLRMCVDFTALNKCCPKDHSGSSRKILGRTGSSRKILGRHPKHSGAAPHRS